MVEKEYIEREAAIDALTERNLVVHMDSVNDGLVASCHRSAQRIIANLPAADVRPVVTCEKCAHSNACLTQAFVEEASRVPFDHNTFFCADGKRADDA